MCTGKITCEQHLLPGEEQGTGHQTMNEHAPMCRDPVLHERRAGACPQRHPWLRFAHDLYSQSQHFVCVCVSQRKEAEVEEGKTPFSL